MMMVNYQTLLKEVQSIKRRTEQLLGCHYKTIKAPNLVLARLLINATLLRQLCVAVNPNHKLEGQS